MGSNLLQSNSRNVIVRRRLTVFSSKQRPNVGQTESNNSNLYNKTINLFQKLRSNHFVKIKVTFHFLTASALRVVDQTIRFRFVLNNEWFVSEVFNS